MSLLSTDSLGSGSPLNANHYIFCTCNSIRSRTFTPLPSHACLEAWPGGQSLVAPFLHPKNKSSLATADRHIYPTLVDGRWRCSRDRRQLIFLNHDPTELISDNDIVWGATEMEQRNRVAASPWVISWFSLGHLLMD